MFELETYEVPFRRHRNNVYRNMLVRPQEHAFLSPANILAPPWLLCEGIEIEKNMFPWSVEADRLLFAGYYVGGLEDIILSTRSYVMFLLPVLACCQFRERSSEIS